MCWVEDFRVGSGLNRGVGIVGISTLFQLWMMLESCAARWDGLT